MHLPHSERAETILLPAFDAWRSGDAKIASGTAPAIAAVGTLDRVFAEYRADRRYTKLDPKSKRNHENGLTFSTRAKNDGRSVSCSE
jgi:hypothetical protein